MKCVLVVDDDPDVLEYLSMFLQDHGYEVRVAADAGAALETLKAFSPDVILVDVLLPGRSGLDLLVHLRRSADWGAVPLVVVTGHDQVLQDYCQSYLGGHRDVRGPDGVLGKPLDTRALLAVVGHLSEGSRGAAAPG